MAHWLFGCTDSGFWLGPEILSFIRDKSRPGDLSKNLSLLGVSTAPLSDSESYDQEIQPRTVGSAVLLRTTLIHEGYLSTSKTATVSLLRGHGVLSCEEIFLFPKEGCFCMATAVVSVWPTWFSDSASTTHDTSMIYDLWDEHWMQCSLSTEVEVINRKTLQLS